MPTLVKCEGQRGGSPLSRDHLHNQAMTQSKPLPPLEELRKAFCYDPDTGLFTHARTKSGRIKKGSLAGTMCTDGYIGITHNYSRYRANRFAWLLGHGEDPGPLLVEHRDRNRLNNRLSNLRLADKVQTLGTESQ